MKLNTNQIEKNLNKYFNSPGRKIVFWYDEEADFIEDVDELDINAKIFHLNKRNSFKAKYVLEIEDKDSNYLVYAPYNRPSIEDNHLADTIEYSILFYANRNALLASKYRLDDKLIKVLDDHSKFFKNKDRIRKFDRLASKNFTSEKEFLLAIMSVLAKLEFSSFSDVINAALRDELEEKYNIMDSFQSFGVYDEFWRMIESEFSYSSDNPTMIDFGIRMFATYLDYILPEGIETDYENLVLSETNNVIVQLNDLKNSYETRDLFINLSNKVYNYKDLSSYLFNLNIHDIHGIDLFRVFDENIIDWMVSRIKENNLDVSVAGMDIEELCDYRRSKYFGNEFEEDYQCIKNAYRILKADNYTEGKFGFEDIINFYTTKGYKVDTEYRKFYYYLDKKSIRYVDEELRNMVEDFYTQTFLNPISKNFSDEYSEILNGSITNINYKRQKGFFETYCRHIEGRTVVIISDAFRYEVGKELVKKLSRDNKFTNISIDSQLSEYPSITSIGMASLLPHSQLYMSEDLNTAYIDGFTIKNNEDRSKVLKSYSNSYDAISYIKLMDKNQKELRDYFKNLDLVYVYQDCIDAVGDSGKTEAGVLNACEEAIEQIKSLIIKLTNNVSITNYIITSDHGFIYTRNKKQEVDKIDLNEKDGLLNKRYYFGDINQVQPGINQVYSSILIGDKKRISLTPKDTHIFKSRGRGQNYYHGGLSLQELVTPVITLNTVRNKADKQPAKLQVITNSDIFFKKELNISFLQDKPLGPSITPTDYVIQFVDAYDNPISDKVIHRADNRSLNAEDRIFSLNFALLNRQYEANEDYFLKISDLNDDLNTIKIKYVFDIR